MGLSLGIIIYYLHGIISTEKKEKQGVDFQLRLREASYLEERIFPITRECSKLMKFLEQICWYQ